MKTVLIFLLLASPALAQDRATALSACGEAKVKFDVKQDNTSQAPAQPETGKALVYVVEDIGDVPCLGGCVTIRVGLDGAWVGANQGNTSFYFSVPPGEHHLCSNWQSILGERSAMYALANFTAEAGKTYYFRTRVSSSNKVPRLDLDAINSDEGNYLVASVPLAVSHPKK